PGRHLDTDALPSLDAVMSATIRPLQRLTPFAVPLPCRHLSGVGDPIRSAPRVTPRSAFMRSSLSSSLSPACVKDAPHAPAHLRSVDRSPGLASYPSSRRAPAGRGRARRRAALGPCRLDRGQTQEEV